MGNILSRSEINRFAEMPDNEAQGYFRTQAIADAIIARSSRLLFPRDMGVFAMWCRRAFDEVEAEVKARGVAYAERWAHESMCPKEVVMIQHRQTHDDDQYASWDSDPGLW